MARVVFNAEVDEASIRGLTEALTAFQRNTQRDMRMAVRTATVDICKSLRKQTAKAKKTVPRSAFGFGESDPKYLTWEDGIHRRMYKRFGGKGGKNWVFWQKVGRTYRARRTNAGGISESWKEQTKAQLVTAARARWGAIHNAGLAKHTWGWMMWRLFNVAEPGDWRNEKVRLTHRHVEAKVEESRGRLPDGTISVEAPIRYAITMINRLRYIRKALQPGALETAVERARKSLAWRAEAAARRGLTKGR